MTKENNKNIMQLENYKFDLQFYEEKVEEMELLEIKLDKSLCRLRDMEIKKYDTTLLNQKIKELKTQIDKLGTTIRNLNTQKEAIESNIESVPQPYKNILFLKYIKDYSYDKIATIMHYSTKRIYQLHKEAINYYIDSFEEKTITSN